MSLRERLTRLRLDGLALEVCRPAGAELEQLEHAGPLRSTFVARLVGDGWAEANALRVLGDVVAAAERKNHEARPTAPASKSESVGKTARTPRSPAPSSLPTHGGGGASTGERRRPRLLGPVRAADTCAPEPVAPRPAPSGTRRLALVPQGPPPAMLLGPGARHDCVHEAECLGRALTGRGNPSAVHCPPRCAHLEAPTHDQRYADAIFGKAPGYSL